jgi:protein-tyrosine phosphatase
MTSETRPGASLGLSTLPNLRDLGGWPAGDGRVRRGVLYRSTELHELAGPDVAALDALGLRTIYDLRTAAERADRPDRAPAGARDLPLDVLADMSGAAPAQLPALLSDPAAAGELLGGDRTVALFGGAYRDIVRLPSALAAYRAMWSDLAAQDSAPALFHCTTGKDRTGWAAASILLFLGVPEEDVRRDYLLTNDQLLPALQPLIDRFAAAGGDPALLEPVLGVRAEYLDTALDEMRTRFGDVAGYFTDGLGLGADTQDRLRAALLDA